MGELTVGWAVFGKEPGTHHDYRILTSTRWPMEPEGFQRAIRHFHPGDPPGAGAGADRFPWAVFSTFRLKNGDQFRGMAITSWSGHADDIGRPIVETRYCCVRLGGTAPVGFRALYEAFGRLTLTPAAGTTAGPAALAVSDQTASDRAQAVEAVGRSLVAEAAAALLDGRTVVHPVTDDSPTIEERLTFMDAVAAFLPCRAPWLTAGSWWDHRVQADRGRLLLTYSTRLEPEAYVLGRGQEPQLSGDAQQYRNSLLRFCEQFNVLRVVEHLAATPSPQRSDLGEALLVLGDLELAATLIRHLRAGTREFALLKRFLKAGRAGELSPTDRTALLKDYLPHLQPDQVTVLDPLWESGGYRLLLRETVSCIADGWSVSHLAAFRHAGARLVGEDQFLAEVGRLILDEVPGKSVVAEELISSVDPFQAGRAIQELLRTRPDLGVGLALRAAQRLDRATKWVELSADGAAGPHPCLDAVAYAVGRRPELSLESFSALGCKEMASWFHLLRVARAVDVTSALRHFVLPLLHQRADSMHDREIAPWCAELTGLGRTADAQLEANRDLLLCRWRQPPTDLATVLWSSSLGVRQAYVDALYAQLCQLPDSQLDGVVGTWVQELAPGWSNATELGSLVLDLLWKVTHRPPRRPDAPVAEDVLRPVSEELRRNPGWLQDQRRSRWIEEMRRSEQLRSDVVEAELAGLPPGAPVPQVADVCAALLSEPHPHVVRRAVAALSRSRPALDPRDCAWLCGRVLQRVHPPARDRALAFVNLLVEQREAQHPGPYREAAVSQALRNLRMARDLLEATASPPSLLGDQNAERFLQDAQPVLQSLAAIGWGLVDEYGQPGRWRSLLSLGRRSEGRGTEDR